MRYHVSPHTGMPNVCRAKGENCPYGGINNHYKTYSEALAASQKNLEKKHGLIRGIRLSPEQRVTVASYVEKEKVDSEVLQKELKQTSDRELLINALEGKLDSENVLANMKVAVQNPNLPRDIIDDILYSDKYSLEVQRSTLVNNSLTSEDLMSFVDNEKEDIVSRSIAIRHPNLTYEHLKKIYSRIQSNGQWDRLPWINMYKNPNAGQIEDILKRNYFTKSTRPDWENQTKANTAYKNYYEEDDYEQN